MKRLYDLLKIYSNNFEKAIKLIPNRLENFFKQLENIENDDILISSDKTILDKLYPNNSDFNDIVLVENIEKFNGTLFI